MRTVPRAFSLIEVLLVMAILALLAAISFAAMGPSRELSRQRICESNLHQLGLAFSMYQADYDGMEPVQGQPMQYWQLGLPRASMALDFFTTYVKNRQVLHCPDYHRNVPIAQVFTTYNWCPDEDIPGHSYFSFSQVVGRRGAETPLLYDDQHNRPLDPAQEPRWAQKRVIVLRLNQAIQVKEVPVRSLFDLW